MKLLPAYTISMISLAGGIGLSLGLGDWQWFSRAGSLVVVAGLMLASAQILEQLQALRHRRHYGEGWAQHDWASEAETQSRARGNGEESGGAHAHGFYLLVIGTLVWGLGDLVGLLA